MESQILTLSGVTKRLENFSLKNLSFSFPCGYIIGLIGTNGSGKTTLLHLLSGLYRQDEGSVQINGKSYPQDEKTLHDELGFVFQEQLFDRHKTLSENAGFYGKYYSSYSQSEFLSYCRDFELQTESRYRTLSKGEELKFQFAFALAHHPNLLLLDEPTANFDPQFRSRFLKCLKDFISDGKHSIVLATHLTADLDRIADYLLFLENGRILLADDMESIREQYRIVTGESYKIKLLPAELVIHTQTGEFGARAIVRHRHWLKYDKELAVASPTVEDLMYFFTKRRHKK